jgi:hypothetical protein
MNLKQGKKIKGHFISNTEIFAGRNPTLYSFLPIRLRQSPKSSMCLVLKVPTIILHPESKHFLSLFFLHSQNLNWAHSIGNHYIL